MNTRKNNAAYGYLMRESSAYVGNEGSYYVGEEAQAANPSRLAIGQARLVSANHLHSGQWARRLFRILDKVPRSKRINSKTQRAGTSHATEETRTQSSSHQIGLAEQRRQVISPEWAARACALNYCNEPEYVCHPHLTHLQRILNTAFRCACSLERK